MNRSRNEAEKKGHIVDVEKVKSLFHKPKGHPDKQRR